MNIEKTHGKDWNQAEGVGVGMLRGGGDSPTSKFSGFLVSLFFGFLVSWFLGFKDSKIPFHVSWKILIPSSQNSIHVFFKQLIIYSRFPKHIKRKFGICRAPSFTFFKSLEFLILQFPTTIMFVEKLRFFS